MFTLYEFVLDLLMSFNRGYLCSILGTLILGAVFITAFLYLLFFICKVLHGKCSNEDHLDAEDEMVKRVFRKDFGRQRSMYNDHNLSEALEDRMKNLPNYDPRRGVSGTENNWRTGATGMGGYLYPPKPSGLLNLQLTTAQKQV